MAFEERNIPPGVGDANDGVDYATLASPGNGIYYGTYNHVSAANSNKEVQPGPYDADARPVLWRVMGEENGDSHLTLFSEFVLDGSIFNTDIDVDPDSNSAYSTSVLVNTTLPAMYAKLFSNGEKAGSNIKRDISVTSGKDHTLNSTVTNQTLYLPWGTGSSSVGGGDVPSYAGWGADDTGTDYVTDRIGTLRGAGTGGDAVYWWLRSPYTGSRIDAWRVNPSGDVEGGSIDFPMGVRPAFKLNPSSVIYTSEIVASPGSGQTQADGTNYFAAAGSAKNFKLTVLNSASTETLTGVPSGAQPFDSASNTFTVNGLAASQTGLDYTINYKVVAEGASGREIVQYGRKLATSNNLDIDISGFDNSKVYAVYVWLQLNNAINSNEGMALGHFTLDNTPPASDTGPGSTPTQHTLADNATGVTVSGQMTSYARLNVRERVLHTEGTCPACDEMRARMAAGECIVQYDISISGWHTGELEVSIPVGEQYNGQTVTILHCKNGVTESVTCVVQNGVARGTFKKLSPFAAVGSRIGAPENTVVAPLRRAMRPSAVWRVWGWCCVRWGLPCWQKGSVHSAATY